MLLSDGPDMQLPRAEAKPNYCNSSSCSNIEYVGLNESYESIEYIHILFDKNRCTVALSSCVTRPVRDPVSGVRTVLQEPVARCDCRWLVSIGLGRAWVFG